MNKIAPDFFQDDTTDGLLARAEWLSREVGLNEDFYEKYLRLKQTSFRKIARYRAYRKKSARLSERLPDRDLESKLIALFRTFQHLFTFLNFDSKLVETMLKHRAPALPRVRSTGLAPPWSGLSLAEFIEKHGSSALPEVDRWLMNLRFGDPYADPSKQPIPQPAPLEAAHSI